MRVPAFFMRSLSKRGCAFFSLKSTAHFVAKQTSSVLFLFPLEKLTNKKNQKPLKEFRRCGQNSNGVFFVSFSQWISEEGDRLTPLCIIIFPFYTVCLGSNLISYPKTSKILHNVFNVGLFSLFSILDITCCLFPLFSANSV